MCGRLCVFMHAWKAVSTCPRLTVAPGIAQPYTAANCCRHLACWRLWSGRFRTQSIMWWNSHSCLCYLTPVNGSSSALTTWSSHLTWPELVVFVAVAVCFLRVTIHEFGCSAPWHVLMENYEQSKKPRPSSSKCSRWNSIVDARSQAFLIQKW